jgi:hypothetical protein
MIQPIWPSIKDLDNARRLYEENEPRDLFYRIATELITMAIEKRTPISVSEALASLLQTWNKSYYRFKKFNNQHFQGIDKLIKKTLPMLLEIRTNKAICTSEAIKSLFTEYESVLGPVGASKCLHLLAPRSFPLWDRAIAEGYGLALKGSGHNAERYFEFFELAQEQCQRLGKYRIGERNMLKAIDEYNYMKFTKGLISD